ncbi:MAG TPA: M1 family metallopeptidase [Gemmatimonadales bacterium]|nr:M1 family metallopeptidase [Gemmatimonadales bacterium]
MRQRLLLASLMLPLSLAAQRPEVFTHADTIRGSNTPERAWWDVTFYDLHVAVSPSDSSIKGWNGISYKITGPSKQMQIDLQEPLQVDSMLQDGKQLTYTRDGNAFLVTLAAPQTVGAVKTVAVYYHGKVRVARRAPWDGGFVFAKDSLGRDWIATACEGLGASVWWPNKDYLADEPDSQRIAITVPDPLQDVSNGRLRSTTHNKDHTTTFEWFVTEPINNYDVAVNAAVYAHFEQDYAGESGKLTMNFWPLAYHLDTAKVQFQQSVTMMKCFEHWFGPYPWYRDGYQLVETPHLGMEHQSAVAYGNHYKDGYYSAATGTGIDLSRSGQGENWDFIIVHESAHEWFGNSITAKDQADMWIHESFANYSENLFVECLRGKEAGADYVIGTRFQVRNDAPIIGPYGVNRDGSGDMYYKGGNMLHTIRQIVSDDDKWRNILRGLGHTFYHQTVTTQDIENYISKESGINLSKVFDEYLRTTMIPVFEYKIVDSTLTYRWANAVPRFDLPIRVTLSDGSYTLIHPTAQLQMAAVHLSSPEGFHVDPNVYVYTSRVVDFTASKSATGASR